MRTWILVAVLVIFIGLMAAIMRYGGYDKLPLVIALAALLVPALNAESQRGFAVQQQRMTRQQTRLADETKRLTKRQGEIMAVLQQLSLIPWLAGRSRPRVGVKNIGHGPATDLRTVVLRPPVGESTNPAVEFTAEPDMPHLGPNEASPVHANRGKAGEEVNITGDVWIVHCGDAMGGCWHAWCNWTRDNKPKPGEPWIFESKDRTPQWIVDNCPRCKELREGESEGTQ